MALVDQKTPRLGLLLPNADNFLQDDVERLIQSFDLLDVLVVTRDQTTGKIADDQLSEVIARLDAQGKIATSALPSSVVQKGADGNIPSGSSVAVYLKGVDEGDDWQQMSLDELNQPTPVGDNIYEYNYLMSNVMEAKVRVKIVLNGTPAARPYVYSLRVSVVANS